MRFRRLVTIMLTLSVVASLMALPVAAIDYSDVVAPLYIGLEDVTADLAISSNGYASCEGSASVRDMPMPKLVTMCYLQTSWNNGLRL